MSKETKNRVNKTTSSSSSSSSSKQQKHQINITTTITNGIDDDEKQMVGGCCVCGDDMAFDNNLLVYCDGVGCQVAVHQGCYGIVNIPDGDWYCKRCEHIMQLKRNASSGMHQQIENELNQQIVSNPVLNERLCD